eukprot:1261972-Prymnesium_polylepis.1
MWRPRGAHVPPAWPPHVSCSRPAQAFYNTIPHNFDRRDTPPVIDTPDVLKAKLDMIESLLQVSEATCSPPPVPWPQPKPRTPSRVYWCSPPPPATHTMLLIWQ